MKHFIRLCLIVPFIGSTAARAGDWTQFRGPTADNIAREATYPEQWDEQTHVAWKVPIPGRGWSSPVIAGDRVFVATAIGDGEEQPRRGERGLVPGALDATSLDYKWKVYCLSLETGKVLWEQTAFEGKPRFRKHRSNTYASETPVTDGERVVAYFGMTGLVCYDLEGNRQWEKDLGAFPMLAGWGTGSSPILVDDLIVIQCDNDKSSFLIALDKRSGDEKWRVPREEQSNWSTPYLWKNKVRTELVTAAGKKMRSYDPQKGTLLWEMNAGGRTATSPVGNDELLYVDSVERVMGSPGRLAAIRAGAVDDISLAGKDSSNASVAWSVMVNTYRNASPLLYADCLYVLEQHGGVVRCFDARTGKLHYQKRMPKGTGCNASPWARGDKVFCLDEFGRTTVLEAGPEFKPVATNELAEDMFWASPAFSGNRLILRSLNHLYCIAP